MTWLRNLFGQSKKSQEPVFVGEQVPINQSFEFTSHKQFVAQHFSFLDTEQEFSAPSSDWYSREYCTTFRNPHIEIEVVYEVGMLPHVTIQKGEQGVPDYISHDLAILDGEKRLLRFGRHVLPGFNQRTRGILTE